ncbi:MAG: BrnT family toxin [Acidobacteriota bacterium]|nr:BrnT family toxin [Acidobacteriota bacterium]
MAYEWDETKNRSNLRKHSLDFADAVLALEDENAVTVRDDDTEEEERFVTIGVDGLGRVLVVVYTWREENIRMISARTATRRERAAYEAER